MPLSPVDGVPGLYYAKKVVDEALEARLFEAVGTLSKRPKASADYSRWAQQWDDPSTMPEVRNKCRMRIALLLAAHERG